MNCLGNEEEARKQGTGWSQASSGVKRPANARSEQEKQPPTPKTPDLFFPSLVELQAFVNTSSGKQELQPSCGFAITRFQDSPFRGVCSPDLQHMSGLCMVSASTTDLHPRNCTDPQAHLRPTHNYLLAVDLAALPRLPCCGAGCAPNTMLWRGKRDPTPSPQDGNPNLQVSCCLPCPICGRASCKVHDLGRR
ncbi:hypothetical protein VTI74DRAFT_10915 [Chaetomium olivicolor]